MVNVQKVLGVTTQRIGSGKLVDLTLTLTIGLCARVIHPHTVHINNIYLPQLFIRCLHPSAIIHAGVPEHTYGILGQVLL